MKIFISPYIKTKAYQILDRLGIQHSQGYHFGETGVTHFFTHKNPDVLITQNDMTEIEKLVEYKLDTRKYLLNYFQLPQENYSLDDKYDLHQVLTALNMPSIPTIYPTTTKEVEDFFAEHGNVFIKPRLFYASTEPNFDNIFTDTRVRFDSDGNLLGPSPGKQYLVDNIQFPSAYNHYYKRYNSLADFNSDISMEEFLSVQTTNALPLQCIIQKDIDPTLSSINHFHIIGYVNADGDVYHESYYVIGKAYDAPPDDSFRIPGSFWQKLVFNPNDLTKDEIENVIRNTRQNYGSDSYNMADKLKQILQYAGVKNSAFSAEGYISAENQVIFNDLSIGNGLLFRREYWSDEQKHERLKFLNNDPTFDESKAVDNLHRYYFNVMCPNGMNAELGNLAKDLNICFIVPIHTGEVFFGAVCYGTDPSVVATNVRTFLDAATAA